MLFPFPLHYSRSHYKPYGYSHSHGIPIPTGFPTPMHTSNLQYSNVHCTSNCKLVQITVDFCSMNYITPTPLFSNEKLIESMYYTYCETQWVLIFYTSQNKFLATPLLLLTIKSKFLQRNKWQPLRQTTQQQTVNAFKQETMKYWVIIGYTVWQIQQVPLAQIWWVLNEIKIRLKIQKICPS